MPYLHLWLVGTGRRGLENIIEGIIVTERERLIQLIGEIKSYEYSGMAKVTDEGLADYLLANGVIVPPVKFGDTVYKIIECFMPPWFSTDDNFAVNNYICTTTFKRSDIYPKNLYFTREEAEKALAEKDSE